MDLTITLAAEEWNAVLDVLGDGRFKLVSPLIRKIVEQAQAQQNQGQEAAAQGLPSIPRPHLHPAS
jgi:hypothetical protein